MKKILWFSTVILCILCLLTACEKHKHAYGEWIEVKAPTCTTIGLNMRLCEGCSDAELAEIPATGEHFYDLWEQTKAPTCVEAGERVRYCVMCHVAETEPIAETGIHIHEKTAELAATKTKDGYETYTCKTCPDSYTTTLYAVGSDSLGFVEKDGEYIVVGATDTDPHVVIPKYHNGKPVTGIGDGAFAYSSAVKSVTIPEGVTSIGSHAFSYSSVTQLVIPNSVTHMGEDVFLPGTRDGIGIYLFVEPGHIGDVISGYIYTFQSFYFYSETRPEKNRTRYWHYVNGVPTLWS